MIPTKTRFLSWAALAALLAGGCATKKYVAREVESAEQRVGAKFSEQITDVEGQVESTQTRVDEQGAQIGQVSKTAQDALDRAIAAGKLAEGKLLYETVLTDSDARFDFDKADLGESAHAALDAFAGRLKSENQNVYIEIQGHTDAVGAEDYNLKLGERRAEAARRYLSQGHQIPLHRMSIISYGESAPIADNSTKDGRAQNRRVALVVLQ